MKRIGFFLSCLFCLAAWTVLTSCGPAKEPSGQKTRLQVVTTLFPLYDFARNVGGEKASVTLLLPPGVEPHSFEPRPWDMVRVHKADIFIYTGAFMEPWAASIIKGADRPDLVVVDSSAGALLREEQSAEDRGDGAEDDEDAGEAGEPANHAQGGEGHVDPHIWLDFGNAQVMVDNILAGFVKKDPRNRSFYERNAAAYKARLRALDQRFREGLSSCGTRLFVHGGHFAFHYLARRYNLNYVSLYGFSPNAEPSPRHVADIVQEIRRHKIKYVFYEELLQPRLAETVAHETGARLLPLNGGHNVSKSELERGVSFISLLESDLTNLRTGLQCQ